MTLGWVPNSAGSFTVAAVKAHLQHHGLCLSFKFNAAHGSPCTDLWDMEKKIMAPPLLGKVIYSVSVVCWGVHRALGWQNLAASELSLEGR